MGILSFTATHVSQGKLVFYKTLEYMPKSGVVQISGQALKDIVGGTNLAGHSKGYQQYHHYSTLNLFRLLVFRAA